MLPLLLALPFIGALIGLLLPRERLPLSAPRTLALVTTGLSLAVLTYLTATATPAEPLRFFREWMPSIGLNFSLWLDGPALFYAWIVLGIGFLIFWYSGYYLDPKDSPWRFYGTMVFFMGAMLGVVISRNVLLMLAFWELTSISSFILIGHWHEKESARQGALRALIVTALGGLSLIAGIAGLYWLSVRAGVDLKVALEWDQLWKNREALMAAGETLPKWTLVLLLMGAFTKSAQFPFQFWLPGAMEAPTPVSAFLHAATMVKAGIYLLGRLYPLFWQMELWLILVASVGCITMLIGGFMALLSHDLKQLLAHSTVSQLGLLTAYYGFGFHMVEGAEKKLPLDLLLVASHAFFKGALFMLIGVIDHAAHTRDWTRLGGLRKTMPVTALLTAIGAASMAGVPFTLGFVAKELFLKASLHLHTENPIFKYGLPALAIFASLFTVAYCLRLAISPFFGKPRDASIHPHEGSPGFLFSPALLIGLCALGAWAPLIEKPIGALVRSDFYATYSGFHLAFFHHVDLLLGIAAFLFAVGAVVFLAGGRFESAYAALGRPTIFVSAYSYFFDAFIPALAKWLAKVMQPPSLQVNTARLLAVVIGLAVSAAWVAGWRFEWTETIDYHEYPALGILILTAVSLVVVLRSRTLIVRVIALSPIGLFTALFFLFFKAPDLALTQILIEIVVLLVVLLLLFRFRQVKRTITSPENVWKHGTIAVCGGLLMAGIAYSAMNSPYRNNPTFAGDPAVHEYYLQNSKYPHEGGEGYPGAENPRSGGGKNVVNVILVDFRGFDTLGEITVLGVAALGVVMLLTLGRKESLDRWADVAREHVEEIDSEEIDVDKPAGHSIITAPTWPSPSLILSELARILPSFLLVVAIVLFFAGHNAPGGGFIAGLMASVAIAVLFVSFRRNRIQQVHRYDYLKLIPVGLLFAVATGAAAMLLGQPFLTSAFTHVHLPLLGDTEFASAMAFDLGVFLVVVGVTMAIIEIFGRE